jgi:hypothetical protein
MSAPNRAAEGQPLTVVAVQPIDLKEHSKVAVRRARVPGGWLMITSTFFIGDVEVSVAVATTFVPDESGAWLGVGEE